MSTSVRSSQCTDRPARRLPFPTTQEAAIALDSSASELAQAILARKHTAEEVTRVFIRRSHVLGGAVNALTDALYDEALARAREIDAALAKGDYQGAPAPLLLGEQDFSSFRAVQCQSKTPFRNVHHLTIERRGDYIVLDIKANAFLHHMVRNITGSLLEVGMQNRPPQWIGDLLAAKNRNLAAATAKPGGLYLVDVDYPAHFSLPKLAVGPLFLPD